MSSRWEQEFSGSVTLKEGRGKKLRRICAKIEPENKSLTISQPHKLETSYNEAEEVQHKIIYVNA